MKILLCLLFFFCVPFVLCENVSITNNISVPITCNDGDCVALVNGNMIFFAGDINNSINLSIPYNVSYEKSVVNISNCSVVNVTNVNLTVQNVTVVSCNTSANLTVNVSGIISELNTTIAVECAKMCSLRQDERNTIENNLWIAQNARDLCEASKGLEQNASIMSINALNSTCQNAIESSENETKTWIYLCVIVVLLLVVWIYINIKNSSPPKMASGPVSMPELQPGSINDLPPELRGGRL